MLNLTIKEQKEILGGKWLAIVYDTPNGKMQQKFDSDAKAREWAKSLTTTGDWKVVEVA
ncbi:hypothetical protein C8E03_11197 [Lachnotalea glycerini]|uniref:Uncharacterized protein n=1 Tax=Lachnotalea glycerini TaxID=1763509 RepID=A0A318EP96_9FIRM|nr:hypothetical protein [Lachnotalea glycerini]PXV86897.1 hypothetical protein C8E03_11197 [Lachnotalea glycerini]